jgi:hypothetical protein
LTWPTKPYATEATIKISLLHLREFKRPLFVMPHSSQQHRATEFVARLNASPDLSSAIRVARDLIDGAAILDRRRVKAVQPLSRRYFLLMMVPSRADPLEHIHSA